MNATTFHVTEQVDYYALVLDTVIVSAENVSVSPDGLVQHVIAVLPTPRAYRLEALQFALATESASVEPVNVMKEKKGDTLEGFAKNAL